MTKKMHALRNHKNLRLVIPGNKTSSVVLQHAVRHRDSQIEVDAGHTKEAINPADKTEAKENEEKPDSTVPFFKLFQFSTTLEKMFMWMGVLCAIVSGLTSPANIYIFGDLVGSMVNAEMINAIEHGNMSMPLANESTENIMDAVTKFAIGNCALGVVLAVFTYFSVMLFNYTTLKQSFRIRTLYFRSVLHQDIAWYDMTRSGEVSSRLTEDVIKYEDGIGEKVVMLVHNVVGFVGCLALGLYSGWLLTLVCLGSVPIMLLVLLFVVRISQTYAKRAAELYAVASSVAEEAISGIRTVVAFAGQPRELQRYSQELRQTYHNNVRQGLLLAIGLGLLWFTIYCSYAIAFWYGVKLILDDRHLPPDQQTYTPQSMIKVFFSVMMGAMNLGACSPFIEAFGTAKASASKVFSVIKRKPAIDSLQDFGHTATDVEGSIEFKNVSFEYPSRTGVKVLKNLNFTVNKGETVALVGNSGCGKSTCIQLLQRFYDPTEGQIFIDGHDLRDLNIKLLRNCFGVVGQEPVLFDTTIAENIRFGEADASTEKIILAAKEANAHDFIKKLPYKYDTLVGEKGAQLSGGQKQRIAIARALIKNPKIILLDEATSALDTRSESKVQAALDKAHKGRTTIVVAHRLSTIKGADKVIVISDGKVVEEGKHDDLMKLKEHYYSLVTSQVSHFSKPDENKNKIDEPDDDEELDLNLQNPEIEDKDKSKDPKVSMMQIAGLNSKEWPFNVFACLSCILFGLSTPLFSIIFGDIIGVLSNPDPDEVSKETNIYSIYFIIIGIITGLSSFIQTLLFRVSGERMTLRLRSLLFGAILRQEMGWFDEPENGTGALCAKLSTEAAAVQGATGQRIGTIVQSCSTVIFSIGLAIYYEWRLGLVGTAFVPLLLLVTYFQGIVYVNETLNYHKSLESSTKIAVEAVGNVRTVIGLCREDTFYNSYVTAMKPSLTVALRNTHFRGLVFGLARSCNLFAYAACMFYGGYLIQNEGLFYGNVFKVSQALILGTTMVANALAFSPNLQKGLVAAEQIIKLIERKPKIIDPATVTENNWVSKATVEYEKVTFTYPTRPETKVLKELEFKVESGTTIALIGSSGCGKSTVIQLLQRFYDLDSGVIEVSEADIRSVTQSALRKQLGLVSQEPRLFARSIAENIGYGDNEREVQMQEIVAAAKKANIHDFIASLPHGYDTKLGDRGTQLSGGQKQRVAIARALVRDPKILLLDEATSALDSESEKIVQAALDKAKAGRTCIMIAHRLSTVVDADKICVMHRGIIVESGTHSELVEKKGVYYGLLC